MAETDVVRLITQRSRVQIPLPLLVSVGQGPFPQREGLWRGRACDHDIGWWPLAGETGWHGVRQRGTLLDALLAASGRFPQR